MRQLCADYVWPGVGEDQEAGLRQLEVKGLSVHLQRSFNWTGPVLKQVRSAHTASARWLLVPVGFFSSAVPHDSTAARSCHVIVLLRHLLHRCGTAGKSRHVPCCNPSCPAALLPQVCFQLRGVSGTLGPGTLARALGLRLRLPSA